MSEYYKQINAECCKIRELQARIEQCQAVIEECNEREKNARVAYAAAQLEGRTDKNSLAILNGEGDIRNAERAIISLAEKRIVEAKTRIEQLELTAAREEMRELDAKAAEKLGNLAAHAWAVKVITEELRTLSKQAARLSWKSGVYTQTKFYSNFCTEKTAQRMATLLGNVKRYDGDIYEAARFKYAEQTDILAEHEDSFVTGEIN